MTRTKKLNKIKCFISGAPVVHTCYPSYMEAEIWRIAV
jgi:hypothetical protein